MRPDGKRWQRRAMVAWGLVLLVISARVLLMPGKQSVYPTFARTGSNWLHGRDLYLLSDLDRVSCNAFRYSPPVAATLAPFSLLPARFGEVAWRLLNAGVLVGALVWWWRAGFSRRRRPPLGVLLLGLLPLVVGNLNNGQSNPLVLGLLVVSVTAAGRRRWNLAAACVAFATLWKVYPLAVGLLLATIFPRRFAGRLFFFLLLGLLAPFALQCPNYVTVQYADWFRYLSLDDRHAWAAELGYRDLSLLLRVCGMPLGPVAYQVIQLAAAAGVGFLCVAAHWAHWPKRRLLNGLLALACCWMTLFGAATESATYVLLAPSLVALLLDAWAEVGRRRWLLIGSYGLLVTTQLAGWFPGGAARVQALGPQPLAAALLLLAILLGWRRDLTRKPMVPLSRIGENPCVGRPLCVGHCS
jgi:hypothetical protein